MPGDPVATMVSQAAEGVTSKTAVQQIYNDYAEKCYEFAKTFNVMILAAAVTNYIPENPYKGKMPTTEDRILIPFIKAPRVIEQIKKINPKITLIGCKLLSGSNYETLIENAYNVVLNAKCNVVIANDLSNLKTKYLKLNKFMMKLNYLKKKSMKLMPKHKN